MNSIPNMCWCIWRICWRDMCLLWFFLKNAELIVWSDWLLPIPNCRIWARRISSGHPLYSPRRIYTCLLWRCLIPWPLLIMMWSSFSTTTTTRVISATGVAWTTVSASTTDVTILLQLAQVWREVGGMFF